MLRALLFCLLAGPAPALAVGGLTGSDVAEIRTAIARRLEACAVARPAAVSFLDLTVMGASVVQELRLTDRSGAVRLAYYAMQRGEDGSWRALGCHLAKPARAISA